MIFSSHPRGLCACRTTTNIFMIFSKESSLKNANFNQRRVLIADSRLLLSIIQP